MDPRLPWVIGLAALVGTTAVWWLQRRSESRRCFEKREEVDLDPIYFSFFAHRCLPRHLVLELWCEVADSLAVPAGKLRPSDRFDEELAFSGWGFDDEVGRLVHAERHRLERGGVLEAHGIDEIQTVGGYIEFHCDRELQD